MITAIDIKTELWNTIIETLINDDWKVIYKYDAFDAGIDFDLIILEKNNEKILFGWDNWLEGEMQCSKIRLKEIEICMKMEFKAGQANTLKPEVVNLYFNK
jgi:hypothetical protein